MKKGVAHVWRLIVTFSWQRVGIPDSLELMAVVVDVVQKELVKKAQVMRVVAVQVVVCFKSHKKCTPSAGEPGSNFYPQALNS